MLKFDEHGLIPAILQDANTREVLMVGYMNQESLRRTAESGEAWFWSRSRQELWHKGATSGNYQRVERITVDCDGDAVLLEVLPDGPACHTGAPSCFFQSVEEASAPSDAAEHAPVVGVSIVEELRTLIAERHQQMPEGSYVAKLLGDGIDRIAKKIGEEAAETIIAAKNGAHDEIVWEVADLWFHTLILLESTGVPTADIWAELGRRRH